MLGDIVLVMMKEYREVLLRMGSVRGNVLNVAFVIGVFGVFMPLQAGKYWLTVPWMPLSYAWLPFFLVSALVADSFAGERERHTLETLLTTALSDRAVLLGKLAAATAYGYGMLLVVMAVSLVTVNLRFGSLAHPVFYQPWTALAVFVLGFLSTLLMAGIGVVISLRAQTVRQAGQALSLGILGVIVLPALAIGYGWSLLPEGVQGTLALWLMGLQPQGAVLLAAAVLAVVDAIVVSVAMARFKRARLVFD